jgi:hypothetical protein
MAEITLAPIEAIRVSPDGQRWGNPRREPGRERSRRQYSAKAGLLAATLPHQDPETVEVDYAVDAEGLLTAILVRDLASGAVLARVPASELALLGGEPGTSGLLYERRG